MERILLVEDDSAIYQPLTSFLRGEGFAVRQAAGQREALALLETEEFDLVLLDVGLRDGNGFSVCSAVKQRGGTAVIFLSASGDEYSVVTGLDLGADDYIAKPFRPRELVSRIRSVLRRTGRVRSLEPWFEVACCPANIARTLASLGQYIYAVDDRSIYVNLLVGSTIETTLRDTDVRIEQRSGLMHGGALELDVRSSGTHPIVVRLRLPKWLEKPVFRLNGEGIQPAVENGYAVLAVNCAGEHHFTLSGSVPVHRCAANLCVRADVGRVALQKGPFVYCFEQQDNGENLAALRMAPDAAVEEKAPAEGLPGDLPELDVSGCRIVSTGVDDSELYADCVLRTEPCMLHAVPYGLWGNRTPGEMRVWVDTTIS